MTHALPVASAATPSVSVAALSEVSAEVTEVNTKTDLENGSETGGALFFQTRFQKTVLFKRSQSWLQTPS